MLEQNIGMPPVGTMKQRSIGEQLARDVELLRTRLRETEEALTALQSNPEVEHIINLISKVHHIY